MTPSPLFFLASSFFFSSFFSSFLFSSTDHPNHKSTYKEETREIAKTFRKTITQILKGKQLNPDAVVQEEDKGKTFNPPDPNTAQELGISPFEQEIISALENTHTFPPIDPDADFLTQSNLHRISPLEDLGASQIETLQEPSPPKIVTCTESIVRTLSLEEHKKVRNIPAETKIIFSCRGHKEKYSKWKIDSIKRIKRTWKEKSGIENLEFNLKGGGRFSDHKLTVTYNHTEGTHCNKSDQKTQIITPAREEISWEVQDQELLTYLENTPHCTQISTSVPSSNKRHRIYRCNSGSDSACQRFREQGAQILDKVCIETDQRGECLTHQKTYEIPQIPQSPETNYLFSTKEDEIWGLNELQIATTKSSDFAQSLSKLYAISALEDPNKKPDPFQAQVFPGQIKRCKRSFVSGAWYDCCAKVCAKPPKTPDGPLQKQTALEQEGLGIKVGLIGCSEKDKQLFRDRLEGKCVFVGNRSLKLGLETERTYICFPTVLSRIIQESGRSQLGMTWGDADKPKPEGLKLEAIQKINFDLIDFTDFILTLKTKIDPQVISKTLQERVSSFDLSQSELFVKTLLKTQVEQCKNDN